MIRIINNKVDKFVGIQKLLEFDSKLKYSEEKYDPYQFIISPNLAGDHLYYICEGKIEEYYPSHLKKDPIVKTKGDWVGLSALFNNTCYDSFDITIEPCILLEFNLNQIRDLLAKNQHLTKWLFQSNRKNWDNSMGFEKKMADVA